MFDDSSEEDKNKQGGANSGSGFDDEDIKKIREADSLRARAEKRHRSVAESKRKRFFVSFSASVVFFLFVVALSFSMMGSAVTIGQVGGFEVFFEEIDGQQVDIYPAIAESAACQNTSVDATPSASAEALPVLKAEVGAANATEIRLTKDVKTPEIMDTPGFRVTINQTGTIASRPDVSSSNLAFKFTNLQADRIELDTDVIIDEDFSQPNDPSNPIFSSNGEFQFSGQNALIKKGEAIATFVAFGGLTIPDSSLKVSFPPFVDATDYTDPSDTSNGQQSDEWIKRVQFAGIDNPSRGDFVDMYEDYTQVSTNILSTGDTRTITVTGGVSPFTGGGNSGQVYSTVWIDWDQDNVLSPDERTDIATCTGDGCTMSDTVTVPNDAQSGITLMRVGLDDFGYPGDANTSNSGTDGEYEDYAMKVAPASDLEPLNVKRTSSCPAIPDVG
jgi:hypothetical protein